ncbi:DUF2740 domain-containing protein [Enterobacteriaceae bacterium 4M9]|nr:DUF2740 domain-containing protein [Enterobacteriaceae bacterium 4M9]
MTKPASPGQGKLHKNLLRDQYLCNFAQPSRLRAEWERVKKLIRGKGHE